MQLFGEDLFDAFIAEKTYYSEKFFGKVTLEVALGLKPIIYKELLVFFSLTISMGLLIREG